NGPSVTSFLAPRSSSGITLAPRSPTLHAPPLERASPAARQRRRAWNTARHRAIHLGLPDFPERELQADPLHDREPEIRLVFARVFNSAIGFVNADQLRSFLEFFLGCVHIYFRVVFLYESG